MIVYTEYSSVEMDLGFPVQTLYALSNTIDKHYLQKIIPKGNGENRVLHVPDAPLKEVQRSIYSHLLAYEEVSPYATAYRFGGSTLKNALPHTGRRVLLKLDIRRFFDHITFPLVKALAFPEEKYAENIRVLLTTLCIFKDALPQGAPTSPVISNIIMRDFDNTLGRRCNAQGIFYTRYCDDMTFSGDFRPKEITDFVKAELGKMGFFLNHKKTTVLRNGQKKTVTGIVVNEKPNISADYKRKIRQEMYFCQKFGIASHLEKNQIIDTPVHYAMKLLGKINYVLSVSPDNQEFQKYRAFLRKYCLK